MPKTIIAMTSWPGRINTTAIAIWTLLERQTVKPDMLVLYLSLEEFKQGLTSLPQVLQDLNACGKIKIRFVKKNTYGHKRYEIFRDKEFDANNCNVITADDDILYWRDYISTLLAYARKYPRAVACYLGGRRLYNDGKFSTKFAGSKPNILNALYSGLAIFPPHTFPRLALTCDSKRNKYCKKCDDSWVNAFLIKNNTEIATCHPWRKLPDIPHTSKSGIWQTHNSRSIKVNGHSTSNKYINAMNAFILAGIRGRAKHYYPAANIDLFNTVDKSK